MFKRGLPNFKVGLGDSNLKIDLQFGVQEHKILQALVHEDYDINDEYHENDIGDKTVKNTQKRPITFFLRFCNSPKPGKVG